MSNFTMDKAFTTAISKCSDNIKRFLQGLNTGLDPWGETNVPVKFYFLDKLGCQQRDGEGIYFRVLDFYNNLIGETQSGSWRSYDQQQKLYNVGRSIGYKKDFVPNIFAPKFLRGAWVAFNDVKKTGPVVTNLAGGASYHNYGLAIDIVLRHYGETVAKNKIVTIDGVTYDTLNKVYSASGILEWARICNLTWGGSWSDFYDPSHFQDNQYKPLPYKVYIDTCLQNKSNCSFESCKEFWNSPHKSRDFQEYWNKALDPSGNLKEQDELYQSWIEGRGNTWKYSWNEEGSKEEKKFNFLGLKFGLLGLLVGACSLFFLFGKKKRL